MHQDCLILAGAHRSLTSLLARQIATAGVGLGDDLLPANEFNKDGYLEERAIVEFHTLLLQRSGQSWLTANEDALKQAKSRDREFIDHYANFRAEKARLWAVKDPRLSIFLPLWREVLPEAFLLAVFRHPADVCRSVAHRTFQTKQNLLESSVYQTMRENPDWLPRMWLNYNRSLIRCWRQNPSKSALISSEQLGSGDNLSFLVRDEWALPVDLGRAGGLYEAKRNQSSNVPVTILDRQLAAEVAHIWEELCQIEQTCLKSRNTGSTRPLQFEFVESYPPHDTSYVRKAGGLLAGFLDRACMQTRHASCSRKLSTAVRIRSC